MLRTSLRSVRAVSHRPAAAIAARQWQLAPSAAARRYFADIKKTDPKPAVLPTSDTNTAERNGSEAPKPTESDPVAASTIPVESAPLTPPNPEPTPVLEKASTTPPPPPPPAGKPKKGFFRRLRNLIFTLTVLGALSFGGGVWYSRVNDNFHDFFTEYVPYGEQAVLYLEELDFRKRFPSIADKINRTRDTGAKVTIPAQSGASWRVADSGEPAGRQSSAIDKAKGASSKESQPKAAEAPKKKKVAVPPETSPADASATSNKAALEQVAPPQAAATPVTPPPEEFRAPEVNEPSRRPPIAYIDPLKVNDALEPVVQDLVHMLNDIITVINADKAHGRYSSTIEKAKGELSRVGSRIQDIKAAEEKKATEEVRAKVNDFDQAANDLVTRLEGAMAAQEASWRKEFDEEMIKVKESYDKRVSLLLEREKQLNEEKLSNRLLEQAVSLKKDFVKEVESRVERERDGRLGKLSDLSTAVADLEKLTVGWNDVVDTNQRTQQLHVAVEAVRATLEHAQTPRPFVRELVALKEIAANDPVVDAAIASINPSAYQRGLSTAAQLIDRFRVVAGEVRKASLLPEDAGVASHASSYVLSKVLFKKQGLVVGDDVESILTRTQTFLEEGDLDGAAREMTGLQGWAKTLSKDWLSEVRKVLEVQQALDVISTEARLQSLRVEN